MPRDTVPFSAAPANASSPAQPSADTLSPLQAVSQRRFKFDSRYIAPVFITIILLVAQLSFGVLESYEKTVVAIVTSIATELILSRVIYGKWPHLASAYVSGISVGILIRSPEVWPFALASMIAITSKYAIRVKGRHIWNPSNFAIAVLLILSPSVSTLTIQWDNRFWAMLVIWTLGSLIVWNLKRFHICATYVVSFLLFAALRGALPGHQFISEVAPITGPMYQLFIFFMITDPKTTVKSKEGQMLVAFLVAAMECVLRLNQNIHAPYYALFTVGPTALLAEMWWNARRSAKAGKVAPLAETRGPQIS